MHPPGFAHEFADWQSAIKINCVSNDCRLEGRFRLSFRRPMIDFLLT